MNEPARQEHPTLLSIDGMSCAGCVRSVETALAAVPGVSIASVNFANQTAAVVGTSAVGELIEAVHQAGYEARPFHNETVAVQDIAIRKTLMRSLLRSSLALLGGAALMAGMFFDFLPSITNLFVWSTIGLATMVVMLVSGGHFYRGAVTALQNRTATMDTLIALGTGTAWLYSMAIVVVPDLVPEESRHQFFEAALFIIGFVNLGKALEANARSRASLAIQRLFDLTPKFVTRLSKGSDELIPVEQVEHDDQLRIKPGEYLPVDGEVVSGASTIDESMLTGESEAVLKEPGAAVRAGTVNLDGSIVIRAVGVGAETMLAGMIRLVSEAQSSKPQIAQLVDEISAVFVPVVILLALITATGWGLFGPEPALSFALVTGMSVLIIACPCALGLAIPMSIMVGLGRAAADGLLIRNSEVLQTAAKLTTIVLDKTGTLTKGEPAVIAVVGLKADTMAIASGLESLSEHPLAEAIVRHCSEHGVTAVAINEFASHVGGGVSGQYGAQSVLMGSEKFLNKRGVEEFPDMQGAGETGSVVYLALDHKVAGYFLLQDSLRENAAATIDGLKRLGVRSVMLSGDRAAIAGKVASDTGIEEVHAELLPEDKLEFIRTYQQAGEVVGMVGDGINDAAALAAADVGFAMGQGTDIAMESADVTLLGESLAGIERSIHLSRKIVRNIYQNLFAAFAYNLLLIPVAAGVLYPFTGLLINPALAGLAMALSSISVVSNAGRLRFS